MLFSALATVLHSRCSLVDWPLSRKITSAVPDWSEDDLIEEIVVKVLGCCEAHPLHSQGCDEAKDDPCSTKHAEHSYMIRLIIIIN